jgi:hypothetical protein
MAGLTTWDLGTCCCGGGPPPSSLDCCPCKLPTNNLVLSWTNSISGPGSAVLTWNSGTSNWTTTCISNAQPFYIKATMICFVAGLVKNTQLTITSYTGAGCTGTPTSCGFVSSNSAYAFWNCNPFSVGFNINAAAGCPSLQALGFTSFTVSDIYTTDI